MPGGRGRQTSWFLDVVREKYRRDGVASLVAAAPRFVVGDLARERAWYWLLTGTLAGRVVTRPELVRRTRAADRLWHCGPQERVRIDAPRGGLEPELAAMVGEYAASRPFVCELRDAQLVGPDPFALTSDGDVVLETADANRTFLGFKLHNLTAGQRRPSALATVLRDVRFRSRPDRGDYDFDAAVSVAKSPQSTFYHWVLEYLPKVRAIERFREATGVDPTVIVGPDPPSYVHETLELAGCDPENIVEWDDERGHASVRRLVVPSHRIQVITVPGRPFPTDFNPSVADCRWLRDRLRSNVPDAVAAREYPSRIYVSREDAPQRRVRNEAAVVDALADFGFESRTLGDLSVAEQVALFSNAETVVAPHGSGLVNAVYADDLSVVELFSAGDVRAFYFCLARQLGFDYRSLVCETVGTDLRVDVDALRRTVADALA